jgi:beta-fructofuranosidase
MKFEPKKSGLLDLDAFYAPKTELDAQGRRILWGWIPERRTQAEMTKAGWSGMMSLPRVLNLDPDGTLRLQVLPQTESLRSESIDSVRTVQRATGEVLCIGNEGSGMEFCACLGTTELVRVTYSAEQHSWLANGGNYPLQPSDVPKVHAFIDGSVIELILSERIGYTKRFYYSGVIAPDITIRASGAGVTLKAWKISPISTDRLTTIGPLA